MSEVKHKVPEADKSLAKRFPKLAAEWHPTKNGNLRPEDVSYGSKKKVWWKCHVADDHEWFTTVLSRTYKPQGCACCAGCTRRA